MTNEPLRILHCLPWIAGGGVERRRLMLARHLDQAEFQQRILIRSCKTSLGDELRSAGVELVELGEGRLFEPRILARAIHAARSFKPHVVHGAVFEGIAVGLVAGRACGAKVVTEETSHATNRSRLGHALFRGMAQLSDACVAISPAVGDYLVNVTGVPRSKVTVITNGVFTPAPPTESRAELRRGFGLSESAFVVGTVCRLMDDSHKRVSDLLRAMAALTDQTRVELLIVGEGKERAGLEQLARQLGVTERVKFAGYRADVAGAYAAMDVFSLVSAREGFGLVVAEAMLAGLPVIATAVGGICDIVEDERTGLLLPPLEPGRIADAIRRLASSPEQCRAMASAGRARAEKHFSAERYAGDVASFYRRLLTR